MYTQIYVCTEISQESCCVTVSSNIKALVLQGNSQKGKINNSKYLQKAPETVQIH